MFVWFSGALLYSREWLRLWENWVPSCLLRLNTKNYPVSSWSPLGGDSDSSFRREQLRIESSSQKQGGLQSRMLLLIVSCLFWRGIAFNCRELFPPCHLSRFWTARRQAIPSSLYGGQLSRGQQRWQPLQCWGQSRRRSESVGSLGERWKEDQGAYQHLEDRRADGQCPKDAAGQWMLCVYCQEGKGQMKEPRTWPFWWEREKHKGTQTDLTLEEVKSPRTGVTSSWELPDLVLEPKRGCSAGAARALNCEPSLSPHWLCQRPQQ